jgi:hypothetical protein
MMTKSHCGIVKYRSVLSSERVPNINKPANDSNKNLAICPRCPPPPPQRERERENFLSIPVMKTGLLQLAQMHKILTPDDGI